MMSLITNSVLKNTLIRPPTPPDKYVFKRPKPIKKLRDEEYKMEVPRLPLALRKKLEGEM